MYDAAEKSNMLNKLSITNGGSDTLQPLAITSEKPEDSEALPLCLVRPPQQ
jgi:hypothetical protein